MKIYSMTATFGKLENQTLTLKPGLNVIHAPNEWGKSTWCAFLMAMLYGIDTRERTTAASLAAKERYAPWSGSPMSGRICLSWNGRDITIERKTKGRIPFGEFSAYETHTGLPVAELTAAGCGETLLGVEASVFARAGFLSLTDLPVSDDEALRRRLNALVTTGDETGASDTLAQRLKELKNRCRHNKTGLLPQAEAQKAQLLAALDQHGQLQQQLEQTAQLQKAVQEQRQLLQNHKLNLAYEAARQDAQRVTEAREAARQAEEAYARQQAQCAMLPGREEAQEQLLHLEQLQLELSQLQEKPQPQKPQRPQAPPCFAGMTPEQALQKAKSDTDAYQLLSRPLSPLLWILAGCFALAAVAATIITKQLFLLAFLAVSAMLVYLQLRSRKRQQQDQNRLAQQYPGLPVAQWLATARDYAAAEAAYADLEAQWQQSSSADAAQRQALEQTITAATGGIPLSACLKGWRETLAAQETLLQLEQTMLQAQRHARTLEDMAKPVAAPTQADPLSWDARETQRRLEAAAAESSRLDIRHGQLLGQMDALGQRTTLQRQLAAVEGRICELEAVYAATVTALETLEQASAQLQRKFAPRISRRAQDIFSRLTGGRYQQLLLDDRLGLHSGSADEVGTYDTRWRSDGTTDQQYLALRLAVAQELTPQAPLVLDDALVRFDDTRMAAAMAVLQEAAQDKQVLLFTCQQRELEYLI